MKKLSFGLNTDDINLERFYNHNSIDFLIINIIESKIPYPKRLRFINYIRINGLIFQEINIKINNFDIKLEY
jgi:hypothetical protein